MTQKGYEKLVAEAEKLFEEITAVKTRMGEGYEDGDLRENNFFDYALDQFHILSLRLSIVRDKILNAKIMDENNSDNSKVGFGSLVEIEIDGHKSIFKILGDPDIDLVKDTISYASPIGKALLGASVGGTVEAQSPHGKNIIKIVRIISKG